MREAAGPEVAVADAEAALVVSWFVALAGNGGTGVHDTVEATFGPLPERGHDPPGPVLTGESAVLTRLLRSDQRSAAWRYYRAVMDLAHATVALGVLTSSAALAALDDLRRCLIGPIDAAGARPGSPPVPGTDRRLEPVAAGTAVDAASGDGRDPAPAPQLAARSVEELLGDLDALVGLEAVKREIHRVTDRLLVDGLRREAGLQVPSTSRHLIFTGNPGTGKTTVARIVGELYATLGVVPGGHVVETDREGLVAGFVGQTAARVRERFDEADGGILLIDEAYSLARGGERDFGREAIDAVVKLSEDRRDRVVVVLAGYPEEMAELVAANPGMASRFPKTLRFEDYLDDELLRIADLLTASSGYRLTAGGRHALAAAIDGLERGRGFGNARAVRSLVEDSIDRQASRIANGVRRGQSYGPRALSTLRGSDIAAPAVPEAGAS